MIFRRLVGLLLLLCLIGHISTATTKSWQHSDKMKEMESSRASIPVQKNNKVNDKLSFGDNVQPTPSMSSTAKVGGFENHSDKRRTGSGVAIKKTSSKVNNKLDKIQGKSFIDVEENLPKYDLGPGVNLTLDVAREIVNVNLDEDYLKDVFQGRGRKHWDLIMKIIPLFIIPFLIQSAIIPFMVSAVKLLLVKSMLIGKTALLLLVFSALKNMYKQANQVYEVPLYNYDGPMRRYENAPINAYKYDPAGPTQWGQ